jgi:hypothetical protein
MNNDMNKQTRIYIWGIIINLGIAILLASATWRYFNGETIDNFELMILILGFIEVNRYNDKHK